ncbi:MAG: AMP-binding protein, partial [Clostridia bacterium]
MRNRPIVWTPDENEKTHVRTFMDLHGIADYDAFIKKSETDIKWFWEAFIQFAGIQFSQPYEEIVDLTGGMVWPKWFTGGKINLVDNMLDKWAVNEETSERIAVMWEGEDGEARTYSYKQLYRETNRFANALHQLGIGKGERVAIFMPMIPETVIALYGIYKAGAVAVPLFSGFGPEAIALRLNDVEACAVVTADGFFRGGNKVLLKQTLDKALQSARTVRAVIVANRFGENHCTMTDRDYKWSELVGGSSDAFETVQTDAEDMCMVSYSSGTTGKPKGIVHVHGGIAVKTAEAGLFVFDVKEDEIFYMITDFGWM